MGTGIRLARCAGNYMRHHGLPPKKICVVIVIALWLLVFYCTALLVLPVFDYYCLSEATQVFITGNETSITTDQGTIRPESSNKDIFLNTSRLSELQADDEIVVKSNRITGRVMDVSVDGEYLYHVPKQRPELWAICTALAILFACAGGITAYAVIWPRKLDKRKP